MSPDSLDAEITTWARQHANPELRLLGRHAPRAQDDYYATNIRLVLHDDDNAELHFRGTKAGEMGEWQVRRMERRTKRPYEGG